MFLISYKEAEPLLFDGNEKNEGCLYSRFYSFSFHLVAIANFFLNRRYNYVKHWFFQHPHINSNRFNNKETEIYLMPIQAKKAFLFACWWAVKRAQSLCRRFIQIFQIRFNLSGWFFNFTYMGISFEHYVLEIIRNLIAKITMTEMSNGNNSRKFLCKKELSNAWKCFLWICKGFDLNLVMISFPFIIKLWTLTYFGSKLMFHI